MKSFNTLQLIQNAVAWVVITHHQEHIQQLYTESCIVARWLPRQFQVLVIIFKPLHNSGPGYLKCYYLPVHLTRVSRVDLLYDPSVKYWYHHRHCNCTFSLVPSSSGRLHPNVQLVPMLLTLRN